MNASGTAVLGWCRALNSFHGGAVGASVSPEYIFVAVRRFIGHWRRAGEIIVPLLILEARNEKNPPGGAVFLDVAASGWWSTKYFYDFLIQIRICAEVLAA
jgi:hypothetical protein